MSEVAFYRRRRPLERVLPLLLEKTLERRWRALVRAPDAETAGSVNKMLWTSAAFLPHGGAEDGNAARQPVYITTEAENPNKASVLFLLGGAEAFDLEHFTRCVCLFDGNDPEADKRLKEQKEAMAEGNHTIAVWQQEANGGWSKEV